MRRKVKSTIVDLLTEFDEMGFAPTTACSDPEQYAIDWKARLLKELGLLGPKSGVYMIRKSIVKMPYDKSFAEGYWNQAAKCPHCKSSEHTRAIPNHNFVGGYSPHVDYSKTVVFECNECGCKWKVKPPICKCLRGEL